MWMHITHINPIESEGWFVNSNKKSFPCPTFFFRFRCNLFCRFAMEEKKAHIAFHRTTFCSKTLFYGLLYFLITKNFLVISRFRTIGISERIWIGSYGSEKEYRIYCLLMETKIDYDSQSAKASDNSTNRVR